MKRLIGLLSVFITLLAGAAFAVQINTSARCGFATDCTVGDSNTASLSLVTDGAGLGLDVTGNALTLTATTTASPTFIGADAATPATTIFDTTGAGTVQIGSADVTGVTQVTDGASLNLEGTTANALTLAAPTTASPTFMGADAASPADTIFDTTGAGTVQVGSADVTGVTQVTDGAALNLEGTTAETLTLTATATNTAVFQGADAAGASNTTLDTTGAGAIAVGSADVTAVTITTDDTGDGTDLVLPANGVNASELNGADVCGILFHAAVNPTEASATDDFMSMFDHGGSTTEGNEDEFIANDALLTFHSLRCDVATAPGAGNDPWAVTIRDDGGDTTVTCTIDETATSCADSTNSAVVAAGSLVNFDISSAGGDADPTANALITCSVCMGP